MTPPGPSASAGSQGPRQARDVMAFGQEAGRVLSDGRIVGRAESYAKVFPSSRVVKRAVGLMAWTVLEDIALDARIDDRGRLVAETTVRGIAANLGLNKDTVTKYLARLREHGFVFQEESREVRSGRWVPCRYVLDPSACIERFTHTPALETPSSQPCPKPSDTVNRPVSEATGHGGTGQGVTRPGGFGRHEKHAGENQQHVAARDGADGNAAADLRGRLQGLGVAGRVADDLVARYPTERVRDAVDAAACQPARNTAGWIVTALRDGWDLRGLLAEQRATKAHRQHQREQAAGAEHARQLQAEQRDRVAGWSAAVSAALGDDQLATAVAAVTTPVPGIERRSVPLAQAQLIAWAVAVHKANARVPLAHALADELATGATTAPGCDAELPKPPRVNRPPDLSARVASYFQRTGERARSGHTAGPTTRDEPDGREL